MIEKYRTGEHALTRKEYDRAIASCVNQEDRVLIMTAASLGIRRADIVRIKIKDINLKEGQLSYLEQKKGNRIRTVPICPKLRQEITILLNTVPKGQDTLFSFGDRQAYNRFQKVCEIAGIPGRPFHALRATCVKFCQAAGWTPEQVAELVGDTIAVIQQHYTTPSKSEMMQIANEKEVI